MKIGVKIANKSPVQGFLTRCLLIEERLMRNLRSAARKSGKELVQGMRDVMENGEWEPNVGLYLRWKQRQGYGSQPLFRTHLLANSIAHKIIEFNPGRIRGKVGWYKGARYGGLLRRGAYTGRVPKRRKRDLGKPEGGLMSRRDTQFLGDVAYWNETGADNRRSRAFVKRTYQVHGDKIISFFVRALERSLPISGVEEAPF